MTLEAWLLFCAAETILCLTPGPAVLLVVTMALTRRPAAGVRAALGILSANALCFAVSATGLGVLLVSSWRLFFAIKWLGAAYLLWLGVSMLLGTARAKDPEPTESAALGASGHAFRHGFVAQAANPKSLLFFTAILPQFVDPDAALAPQIAILGASSVAIEFVVLAGYARASSGTRGWFETHARQRWLERAGGGLLIGAAVGLARLRQRDAG